MWITNEIKGLLESGTPKQASGWGGQLSASTVQYFYGDQRISGEGYGTFVHQDHEAFQRFRLVFPCFGSNFDLDCYRSVPITGLYDFVCSKLIVLRHT